MMVIALKYNQSLCACKTSTAYWDRDAKSKIFHNPNTMLQYSVTHVNTHDKFVFAIFVSRTNWVDAVESVQLFFCLFSFYLSWCVCVCVFLVWNIETLKRYALETLSHWNDMCAFAFLCAIFYCLIPHFTFSWFLVCQPQRLKMVQRGRARDNRSEWVSEWEREKKGERWRECNKGDTSNKERLFAQPLHCIGYIGMLIADYTSFVSTLRLIMKWINYQLTQTECCAQWETNGSVSLSVCVLVLLYYTVQCTFYKYNV